MSYHFKAPKWFAVYDQNDNLLAHGTASDCAKQLGISVVNFWMKNGDYKRGKIKKWIIIEVEEVEDDFVDSCDVRDCD